MPNLSDVINALLKGDENWRDFTDNLIKDSKFGNMYQGGKVGLVPSVKSQNSSKTVKQEKKTVQKTDEEIQEKRRNDSKNIIMNSANKKQENNAGKDELNGNEIFPLDFSSDNVVQGFIFSEVLGKPVCKRRRGARW